MTPRPRKLKLLRWLPRSLVTTTGPREQHGLYLSFDDGPHPEYTPRVLDLLAEHDAKATFYLIGNQIEANAALVARIAAEGHTLGNHSMSHPHFEELSSAEQLDEVDQVDRLLSSIDGRPRHSFRPPRGVLTVPMLARFFWQRRRVDYWSYDSLDYSRRPATELVEVMRSHPVRAGDIILMHDDGPISLDMLRILIPAWKAEGFSLLPLPRRD